MIRKKREWVIVLTLLGLFSTNAVADDEDDPEDDPTPGTGMVAICPLSKCNEKGDGYVRLKRRGSKRTMSIGTGIGRCAEYQELRPGNYWAEVQIVGHAIKGVAVTVEANRENKVDVRLDCTLKNDPDDEQSRSFLGLRFCQ